MINEIVSLLMVNFILVYIIELSGFIDQMKYKIYRMINGKIKYNYYTIKPFDCAICMIFWISGIYLLTTDLSLLEVLFYSSLNSWLSIFIKKILLIIQKIIY